MNADDGFAPEQRDISIPRTRSDTAVSLGNAGGVFRPMVCCAAASWLDQKAEAPLSSPPPFSLDWTERLVGTTSAGGEDRLPQPLRGVRGTDRQPRLSTNVNRVPASARLHVSDSELHGPIRRSYPQRRDRRARRPRQDDAGRPVAATVGKPARARPGAGAGDGLQRPRTRARHHHSRQEHGDRLAGLEDQHRRHARTRRLRRRGRAGAVDGRFGAAAGRRGRRTDAADDVRHPQGAGARVAADRRRQQGGPAGGASGMGGRADIRSVRPAGRHARAARFSGALRLGDRGLGIGRRRSARPRHDRAVPDDRRLRAGAGGRSGGRCRCR